MGEGGGFVVRAGMQCTAVLDAGVGKISGRMVGCGLHNADASFTVHCIPVQTSKCLQQFLLHSITQLSIYPVASTTAEHPPFKHIHYMQTFCKLYRILIVYG